MTYDEIIKYTTEQLLEYYVTWKSDIALIYGDRYAEKYCTYDRYKEHLEVMGELAKEDEENGR